MSFFNESFMRAPDTELPSSVVTAISSAGHPTTGTWAAGQSVVDSNAVVWYCTTDGTPGTWIEGSSGGTAAFAFGTAASRPAAAAGNAHTGYYATDSGEITVSDGTAWYRITRVNGSLALGDTNSVGTLSLGPAGVSMSGDGSGKFLFNPVGSIDVTRTGAGYSVAEGTNAKQGVVTLAAGTATVSNTSVTSTSRIFLTIQSPGGTVGSVYVSARTAGTSFTITSTSAADTSVVAYEIFEVG